MPDGQGVLQQEISLRSIPVTCGFVKICRGAKLIFASTTPVPENDAAKYVKDSELPYNEIAKKVMTEEGVTWNDLWSLVRPRQAELQIPRNAHFQPKGSSVMAQQVAQVIQHALSTRPNQP